MISIINYLHIHNLSLFFLNITSKSIHFSDSENTILFIFFKDIGKIVTIQFISYKKIFLYFRFKWFELCILILLNVNKSISFGKIILKWFSLSLTQCSKTWFLIRRCSMNFEISLSRYIRNRNLILSILFMEVTQSKLHLN